MIVAALRLPNEGHAVVARDGWVYVAVGPLGVAAIDGREPGQPHISDIMTPDAPYETGRPRQQLVLNGRTLWFLDGDTYRSAGGPLHALDVTTPGDLQPTAQHEAAWHIALAGSDRLLVDRDELQLLDVRDPARPVVLGSYSTMPWRIGGIDVQGGRALLLTETQPESLLTIDLDQIAGSAEETLEGMDLPELNLNGFAMATSGRHLVVNRLAGGFDIVDTRPQPPVQRASLPDVGSVQSVAVEAPWAYLDTGGVTVFDVSDPAQPRRHGVVYLQEVWPRSWPALSVHRASGSSQPVREVTNSSAIPDAQTTSGMVLSSGITSDAFSGALTLVDVSDPDQPKIASETSIDGAGGHHSAVGVTYVSQGINSVVVAVEDPAGPQVVTTLPYQVQEVDGDRAYAVESHLPNALMMLDLTHPHRPTTIASHSFADPVLGVAAGKQLYVLTRGQSAALHVLGRRTDGALQELGSVVVDPSSDRLVAIAGGVVVGLAKQETYGPQRWGLQLIEVDGTGVPWITDVVELPGLAGLPAVDEPLLYVPADRAGVIVFRADTLSFVRP
jgi:hypothetical protein